MPLSICQTYQKELPFSVSYNLHPDIEIYNLNAELSNRQDDSHIKIIDNDTIVFFDPIIGETFSVHININSIGRWNAIENGDSIWQLQVNSTTGSYMMLIFDDFYLPYGTKLFVYSTNKSQILGPFTDENNYPSRKFTTAPLKTNSLIIEYYKPYYIKDQAKLNIKSVGLIDESFTKDLRDGFGSSDSCMINVMCPEYANWCNQRRSVVLNIRVIELDSTLRRGTCSLLTNEKRDGKPFLLTAFHVVATATEPDGSLSQSAIDELQNWVFIFNYQSPTCLNPMIEPTFEYFISGATYICGRSSAAVTGGTDYALLQLNQKPPSNYNAYYNGWSNNKDDITDTGVGIHHPQWDIKKIAEWKRVSTGINRVTVNYTQGGTQQGSSGSPLFNASGYVIGQLTSGSVKYPCGEKSRGNYGRFDKSWNFGLREELNPNGTHAGGYYDIVSMNGSETCKLNWSFINCNDLHTSDNVGIAISGAIRQYDGVYNAKDYISAENTVIQFGTKVIFEAGIQIVLKPGFSAAAGSNFIAKIGDCELGCSNGKNIGGGNEIGFYNSNETDIIKKNIDAQNEENHVNTKDVIVYPNPNHGIFSIKLPDKKNKLQKIIITDARGVIVYNNSDDNIVTNDIQLSNLVAGIYIISLYYIYKILTSKFAVL